MAECFLFFLTIPFISFTSKSSFSPRKKKIYIEIRQHHQKTFHICIKWAHKITLIQFLSNQLKCDMSVYIFSAAFLWFFFSLFSSLFFLCVATPRCMLFFLHQTLCRFNIYGKFHFLLNFIVLFDLHINSLLILLYSTPICSNVFIYMLFFYSQWKRSMYRVLCGIESKSFLCWIFIQSFFFVVLFRSFIFIGFGGRRSTIDTGIFRCLYHRIVLSLFFLM